MKKNFKLWVVALKSDSCWECEGTFTRIVAAESKLDAESLLRAKGWKEPVDSISELSIPDLTRIRTPRLIH